MILIHICEGIITELFEKELHTFFYRILNSGYDMVTRYLVSRDDKEKDELRKLFYSYKEDIWHDIMMNRQVIKKYRFELSRGFRLVHL